MTLCHPYPPQNHIGYYNHNTPYYPETIPLPCEIKYEPFQQQQPQPHHSNAQPNFSYGSGYPNTPLLDNHHIGPHTENITYQVPKYENEGPGLFDHQIQSRYGPIPHHLTDYTIIHQNPGEEPKYKCNLCPKVYKRLYTILSHLEEHQSPRVGFVCELCHKHLKTKAGLNMHMRRHTGEVNYACKLCLKASFSPSEHNRHFPVHWRETPQEAMERIRIRMALLQAQAQNNFNFPLYPSI